MKNKFSKKESSSGILRFFSFGSTDLFLKIVSLALAIVLWFFVGGEDTIEKTVRVPVEVINLPRDLVISNQFKNEIEVSLSGPRSVVLGLNKQKLTRQVDLSQATPGTMVLENDNEHIVVPRSLTVQRVQPASIILSIDKLIQKQFRVMANTVGNVADGFEVQQIRMNPDYIVITGPETLLRQSDELQSSYISINGLKTSQQMQVPLELAPALVDLIGETSVTADIMIAPIATTKVVNIPVKSDAMGELEPNLISVTAKIPDLLLETGEAPETFLHAKVMEADRTGRMKVVVVPRNNDNLPINILSIIPAYVQQAGGSQDTAQPELGADSIENTDN